MRNKSISFWGGLFFKAIFGAIILASPIVSCGLLRQANSVEAINPRDFGILEAKTGIECYNILKKTHEIAIQKGVKVSYKGISEIDLEIPSDATGIKVGCETDFHGVVINVRNQAKNISLFSCVARRNEIVIAKLNIDNGDFTTFESFKKGKHIIIVEDENPWGDNRSGYEYSHKRKDVILVVNGNALNRPVMPYDNSYSAPKCLHVDVENNHLYFKNLTVNRTNDSTCKTFVLSVDGYNDVKIENVTVNTPDQELIGDHIFRINNSTNVEISGVKINGTYSSENQSGYGISMNNIWNFRAFNLYCRGKWGVFGCNNINTAYLENCDINRFDIHCYGKNCTFKGVNFVDIGNQFSSVYGIIKFDKCQFTNCNPLINRSSYNAFVEYELYFENCTFNVTPKKKYLINMGELSNQLNTRPELRNKCWPNIHIKDLTVNMKDGAREFVLLTNRGPVDYQKPIGYMEIIEIDGMTVNCESGSPLKSIVIGTKNVGTENKIDCVLKDVIIKELGTMTKGMAFQTIEPILSVKIPLKGNRVQFKNVVGTKK